MMTFNDYCLLCFLGCLLMMPYTLLIVTDTRNKLVLILTSIVFFVGFIILCVCGTRALETFPSIAEIKELLK